ncbi:hypothetical protein EYC84_005901 [Monilinia fructicola]|uniref:Uncharacterized protein n=1 Tax=Monilinia fructicola TaxID=38448 RepID=A0A5M9JY05_MONFR|nr:hypothetical protein EYC84_005901 [Monilinia fructicola]
MNNNTIKVKKISITKHKTRYTIHRASNQHNTPHNTQHKHTTHWNQRGSKKKKKKNYHKIPTPATIIIITLIHTLLPHLPFPPLVRNSPIHPPPFRPFHTIHLSPKSEKSIIISCLYLFCYCVVATGVF